MTFAEEVTQDPMSLFAARLSKDVLLGHYSRVLQKPMDRLPSVDVIRSGLVVPGGSFLAWWFQMVSHGISFLSWRTCWKLRS